MVYTEERGERLRDCFTTRRPIAWASLAYVFSVLSMRWTAEEPERLQDLSPGRSPGLEAISKNLSPVRAPEFCVMSPLQGSGPADPLTRGFAPG